MTAVATPSPGTGDAIFSGAHSTSPAIASTGLPFVPHTSLLGNASGMPDDVQPEEELPEPICGGCKRLIDEESADTGVIHFATQLWHVECFRCAKCRNPVTTDRDDILLLSDGHPICGQCNYSCQICNLPIMEEAIMTGDESYHASCFVCRSCQTPIAELVFAKTSQGIYCMKCHNQRVARSRRHAEKKRAAAAAAATAASNASISPAGSASGHATGVRPESGKSPTTPTFAPGVDQRSPSISSTTPHSPLRKEAANTSTNLVDRASKQDLPASSSPLASLSPYMASGSSSSLTRPSSAGQGTAKRPQNAPPPVGLRPVKKEIPIRPATADSTTADNTPSSSSAKNTHLRNVHQSTLAKLDGDIQSPLLAGVMEQAADQEKRRQQAEREHSQSQLTKNYARSSSEQRISETHESGRNDMLGLGIGLQQQHQDDDHDKKSLSSSRDTPVPAEDDSLRMPTSVQLKRASRLHIGGRGESGNGAGENVRVSRAFSFYDPDFVGLMDSFGRFDSSEDFSLDSVTKKNSLQQKESEESTGTSGASESNDKELPSIASVEGSREKEEQDSQEKSPSSKPQNRGSVASLSRLSETMRQSLHRARDGHINMDTAVIEGMLDELDATRERMKTLQRKYERIRRASQQAAQGFSTAREEYEQEVQARYDAEADMLNLKRQLHMQASRLAELATEKRQQESLQRRNVEIKSSIQDMERDLAKLRIERDLTLAEVAELLAMQEGRGMSSSGNEDVIKRNLIHRLDGVKEKYRSDLESLAMERSALSQVIEELRQSRDVFNEETQALNARNEELSGALSLLQRRVEHVQAAEKLASQRQNPSALVQTSAAKGGNAGAFGFGFGGHKQARTPLSSTHTSSTAFDPSTGGGHGVDWPEQVAIAAPVPVTKIESAPKKFKWMKAPKLTAESAKNAGQHLAAALPGVSPAVPSKNGLPTTPNEGQAFNAASSMQQQAQQSTHPYSHQHKQSQDHSAGLPSGAGQNGAASSDIVVKEHLFQPFNVLRPVRCFACQKNMWGQSELKCTFCNQACHVRCLHNLPISCNQPYMRSDETPAEPSGPPMFGRKLSEQVLGEGRSVPLVVQKCVEVVEIQGMDYEGIYRKSGGTSQLKIITQLFEKGQPFNLDDRDRFNDISAITSVLKNYFRELPEPLLTFELHESFINCSEAKTGGSAQRLAKMRELVHLLPKEHFDTLKFLINHLHRVQARAEENRMSSRNLGVVFGPTLMRSSDPSQEFAHMGGKAMTIEFMIDNPSMFE